MTDQQKKTPEEISTELVFRYWDVENTETLQTAIAKAIDAERAVIEAAREFLFVLTEADKAGLSPWIAYEDALELNRAYEQLDALNAAEKEE